MQQKCIRKSDETSSMFSEKANNHVKLKEYLEALINYNKALSFAENSQSLAKNYANRSAVFLENKHYEMALNNISLARELDPCSDRFSHLNEGYKKCMAMIRAKKQWLTPTKYESKEGDDEDEQDPSKLIQLSYPKNPKIPFVCHNIDVHDNENEKAEYDKVEKYLYATEPLRAGDVIAIETSMINLITEEDRYKRCCWCASANKLNLIPCLYTASLMFCSLKCRNETYLKMPVEQLSSLVDDSNGTTPLIFAGKFNEYLQSGCLFDFDLSPVKEYNDDLRKLLVLCNVKKKEKGQAPYTKIFHMTYHDQLLNYGFSLIGSLISHSCDPNVAVVGIDNKFVYYVVRPIGKGDALEICYGTEFFYQERQVRSRNLYEHCGLVCTCDACIKNYAVLIPKREIFIQSMAQNNFSVLTHSLQHYFNIINNKGIMAEKSKELCTAQDMIWQLMQELGHYLTYGQFGPHCNGNSVEENHEDK